MNADIMTPTKPSWLKIAKALSEVFGRPFDATYVQKVAAGKKINHQITPALRTMGVMHDQIIASEDGVKVNPESPSSRVSIPPEAVPYCDHLGIIDWDAVKNAIRKERGLDHDLEKNWRLSAILNGDAKDEHDALPIMRSMKLDQIISYRKFSQSLHTQASANLAIKYAKDFDIDIAKVPGTGAGGVVLKRDVVAYRRLLKAGKLVTAEPTVPTEDASTDSDDLLTEQSAIIKSQRLALDAAHEVAAEYRAQIDALQARVSQLESREVQVTTQPRQIHITLNLDGALA